MHFPYSNKSHIVFKMMGTDNLASTLCPHTAVCPLLVLFLAYMRIPSFQHICINFSHSWLEFLISPFFEEFDHSAGTINLEPNPPCF